MPLPQVGGKEVWSPTNLAENDFPIPRQGAVFDGGTTDALGRATLAVTPVLYGPSGNRISARWTDQDTGAGVDPAADVALMAPASGGGVQIGRQDAAAYTRGAEGILPVVGDTWLLTLTSAAPTPPGTDILTTSGAAVAGADLAIRNTSAHTLVIPMLGWRRLALSFYTGAQFDQSLTLQLLGGLTSNNLDAAALLTCTIPASTTLRFTVGDGAVGQGGVAGGATAANQAHYALPSLNAGWGYVIVYLVAGTGPSAGNLEVRIARSRL